MRAVALLRGVNVGGVRFAMGDLREALAAAGFADVRTVLASGNVLLTGEGSEADVAARVAAVVEARFGHRIAVIAVPVELVAAAAAGYPFARAADRSAYVVFGQTPAALRELAAAAGALDPAVERVAAAGRVLYWDAPKGGTLTTAFGTQYGRRQVSGAVTTRKLETLERVLAAG